MNSSIIIPDISPYELPRICADLPVIGGRYKTRPEDFRVDELPHTTWSGTGDYLYLQVEKRKMGTPALLQHLQSVLQVPFRSIRIAGRKDQRAVTSQWISVRDGEISKVKKVEEKSLRPGQSIKILDTDRHHSPMTFGVHGGNRFHIIIRKLSSSPQVWQKAQMIAEALKNTGIPNYFGEQRLRGDYAALGKEILLDVYEGVPATQARFLMSSYQAQLFNRCLVYRIEQGYWNTVLEGDWLRELTVEQTPRMVQCTQLHLERWQQEYDELAYLITGPMFGKSVSLARGLPGCWEQALLDQEEIALGEFYNKEFGFPRGSRRSIRLPVIDLALTKDSDDNSLHLDFTLPPGGYATIVLREFGVTHATTT